MKEKIGIGKLIIIGIIGFAIIFSIFLFKTYRDSDKVDITQTIDSNEIIDEHIGIDANKTNDVTNDTNDVINDTNTVVK